jgi:hypothetical protein
LLEIAVPRERKLAVMQTLLADGTAIRDFHSQAPLKVNGAQPTVAGPFPFCATDNGIIAHKN